MAVDRSVALIGAGNMGEALLRGLLGTATITPERCVVTNKRNDERLARLAHDWGVRTTRDKEGLMREAEVVILAVKPRDMPEVLGEIAPHAAARHLVVSVAAGIPLETIERHLDGVPVVRTMPNTSTAVNASATAVC
ncbi:MAG TPA: NAD(P)-binding domain-containing protein, partial [bacterium]|nr:NAD(P)-binding domain-containing protein [bacterium]